MASIECPTCDQEMALSARRCLHCGALSPRARSVRSAILLVVVLTAVAAVVLTAVMAVALLVLAFLANISKSLNG